MIFILGLVLKLPWLLLPAAENGAVVIRPQDGFLYDRLLLFLKPVVAVFPSFYTVLAFLLLFWQAYLLTNFINNQRLVNKANYLPGMALMLVSSFIPEFNYLSAPLIVSFLFLLSFIFIFRAHSHPNAKGLIFNCGLVLGATTMFFQPAAFFIIWGLLALGLLRPFRINEWLLLLVGFFTPYYFYLIYLFLSDQWATVYTMLEPFSVGINLGKQPLWFAGALFLTILPLLAGVYSIHALSSKMLIQVRKGWMLFLIYFVVAVGIAFVNPGAGFTNWVLVLVPCAAVHGFGYLNSEVRLYPVISFWLTVGYIIAIEIAGYGGRPVFQV
ncbi:hypothetical protein [Niabella drilacis]|uniref:Beta-carotene 15,15'-monooxygenase n=1 Tax=Niabella drilacis (strain DSM 25811 / CCM 8410 / CCUG 62505 / LMG 26954 / E90) TaxID=1285928 RepID=A0A1G6RYK2_NIADE|nr:hypothetical protein [Niabella drilacis]SDD09501.1 hypothetical protein SAMN04487894_1063 [Niabella drilacis]